MTSRVRTIVLWVVLMVLFFLFYRVFSTAPATQGAAPPVDRDSLWSSCSGWLLIVALVTFFVFYFRRVNARNQVTNNGVQLLSAGRYFQALEIFEQQRVKDPKQPVYAFNAGSAKLHLWKLDAALTDFEAASSLLKKGANDVMRRHLLDHRALILALLGRTGDAWRQVKDRPLTLPDTGRYQLTEGVLLAREGNFGDARRKLNAFEVKQLGGTIGALARTVDALCIEKLSGELRHVDRVALFGEAAPDELERVWPELVDFVKRAPAW